MGLVEIFVKLFAPGWYEAITYAILIVILLVKPAGILGKNVARKFDGGREMQKNHKVSYFINFLGILVVFGIFALLFEGKAFGTSTQYIKGICTTACYTIIMVASLNW